MPDFNPFEAVGAAAAPQAPETIPGFGKADGFRYRLIPGTTGIVPEDMQAWKTQQQTDWERAGKPPTLSGSPGAEPNFTAPAGSAAAPQAGKAAFDPFAALGAPVAQEAAGVAPGAPSDASAPPGKKTGYLANIAAGGAEGLAGLINAASDPFGNLVGKPAVIIGMALHDALAPVFGYQPLSDDFRHFALDESPEGNLGYEQPGTNIVRKLADAFGAPLSDIVPATPGEGMARAGAQGVVGGALAGGVGAVAGAVGGIIGHAAAEAAPDRYKDVAGLVGNLAGGTAAAGGAAGLRGTAGMAQKGYQGVRQPLGIGPLETPVNPATGLPFVHSETGEPISHPAGQLDLAGKQIRDAAGPGGVGPSRPGPIIEGSQPTLGQEEGNLGLLGLERRLRSQNKTPFTAAEAENMVGRVKALEGMLGPEEAGAAAGKFFADQRARLEKFGDEAEASARSVAEGKAGDLPTGVSDQDMGAAHRTALEALRKPVMQAAGRLYDAVDPDGTLAVGVKSVADVAKKLKAQVNQRMGGKLSAEEEGVLDAAANMRSVELFSDLRDLDSEASAAQRAIKTSLSLGAESKAFARVTQLRNAIAQAMDTAVEAATKKDPAVGKRLAEEAPRAAENAPGASDAVFTPSGDRVGVRYRLREAGDLITSHNDDMSVNPEFPAELQPRQRERAASQQQVDRIASRLNPEQLGGSSSLNEGAPIVGPDGVVESGNARTIALRRVLAEGGDAADRYRAWLKAQGYDADGMKAPVLVRERTSSMTPEERARFAEEATAPTGLAMSASEKAGVDAGRITPAMLSLLKPGEIGSAANREFVRAFVHGVAESAEHNALFTEKNGLSLEGAQRIRSALMQRAYGDRELVSAVAESGDENIRGFGNALADAAPSFARLRGQIESGRVDAGTDIGPDLLEAVRLIRKAKTESVSLADVVGQTDMFGADRPALTEALLHEAYGDNLTGRLSQARMGDLLRFYAEEAEKQTTASRLFGANAGAAEILAEGIKRGRSIGSAGSDGAGPGAAGHEGGGLGHAPAGEAASSGVGVAEGARQGDLTKPPLVANLDRENVSALRAANKFYAEYKDIWRRGGVGEVLRSAAGSLGFKVGDSAVPSKLFRPGAAGAEAADSLIKATGSPEAVVALLGDYPAASFRRAAEKNGLIDPVKAKAWIDKHQAALDKLPGLRDKFSDAAAATRELERVSAENQAKIKEFQESAARHYLNKAGEPLDSKASMQSLLGSRTAAADAREIMTSMKGDEAAIDGFRRNLIEHVIEKTRASPEAGTTGVREIKPGIFKALIEDPRNQAVMRIVLGDDGLNALKAIGIDMEEAARAANATKIPGSPGTAADAHALARHMGSNLGVIGQVVIGEMIGNVMEAALTHGPGIAGGILGTGLAATGAVINGMRLAGLATVDDLVTQGVLQPDLGRLLARRVNLDKNPDILAKLIKRIGAIGVSSATRKEDER